MLGLFVFLITSQNNNRQKIDTFTLMEVDILIVLGSKIRRNSKLIDQENVKITLKIKKKKNQDVYSRFKCRSIWNSGSKFQSTLNPPNSHQHLPL